MANNCFYKAFNHRGIARALSPLTSLHLLMELLCCRLSITDLAQVPLPFLFHFFSLPSAWLSQTLPQSMFRIFHTCFQNLTTLITLHPPAIGNRANTSTLHLPRRTVPSLVRRHPRLTQARRGLPSAGVGLYAPVVRTTCRWEIRECLR